MTPPTPDDHQRVLIAQLHVMLLWTIARERFGVSLSLLTEEQSKDVQDTAYAQMRYFAAVITPEKIAELVSPLPPEATMPMVPPGSKIQ